MIIALRSIQFSDCYVQREGFTASAIQWASETFDFPMPIIETHFDRLKSQNGMYIFDFHPYKMVLGKETIFSTTAHPVILMKNL